MGDLTPTWRGALFLVFVAVMGIGESIKVALGLAVKVRDAKLQADIQAALISAQGEALSLQQRVSELLEENDALKAELRKKVDTPAERKSINGIWWGVLPGEKESMPFCPKCAPDKWAPLERDFRFANGRVRDDGEFTYCCGACGFLSVRNIEDERSKGALLDPPPPEPRQPCDPQFPPETPCV